MKEWTTVALTLALGLGLGASGAVAQGSGAGVQVPVSQEPRLDMASYTRPIEAVDNVWIEDLTELEVRDALKAGKTNVLILTGSVELNGPYLTTGKHNNVLRVSGEAIARKMGDMLIAPIVPIEAGDPARSTSPGSVALSREVYKGVLKDMATSYRAQGFKNVFFVGDSGGNVQPDIEAVEEIMASWKGSDARAFYVPEYYNYDEIMVYQKEKLGVNETRYLDRFHDNYYITTMIMVGDPDDVRLEQRIKAGKATINGFSLLPLEKSLWHGRQLVEFRADATVAGMRKAMGGTAAQPQP
jgi:creatinine amidohydrolase/Fe(II)-dependent formamide hydrolase-like protein